jgi:rod shape-determining protein MreC
MEYTSVIYHYKNSVINYIDLKKENEYLASENAKLYSVLQKEDFINYSLSLHQDKFSYEPAKVINNSINKRNNFITLNKGSKHGVKKGMGVITKNGVIGIIHSISENYAIVISLLNRESSLSVKLKKNNHNGILRWAGYNYRIANITNFPSHIKINEGDTIATNSHSTIFPEKINIGKILSFEKDEKGYFDVKVKLFEDFNQINYVYIIHDFNAKEQEELEKNIND